MSKKKDPIVVKPPVYSNCLECINFMGLTYYNRIECKSALVPVENCKDRKIECVRFHLAVNGGSLTDL